MLASILLMLLKKWEYIKTFSTVTHSLEICKLKEDPGSYRKIIEKLLSAEVTFYFHKISFSVEETMSSRGPV